MPVQAHTRVTVPGVVVRLDAARASEAVAVIDAIEEEGRLYRRVEVVTSAGCAFAYEWLGRTEGLEPLRDGWPRTGETREVAAGARRSLIRGEHRGDGKDVAPPVA